MTIAEAQEEVRLIVALQRLDSNKAVEYLRRLVTDAYGSGWDAAFDTAPDNFKPTRRQPRFTLERAR